MSEIPVLNETRLQAILARLAAYLENGGLFNPELADHHQVRELIIDARDLLVSIGADVTAQAQAIERLTDNRDAWSQLAVDAQNRLQHTEAALAARDRALRDLVGHWRVKGATTDTFHATMGIGWKACADELDALLSRSASPTP